MAVEESVDSEKSAGADPGELVAGDKWEREWPNKKPRLGRPPIIVLEELEKLCRLQCTQEEIAAFFGITVSAVEKAGRKKKYRDVMERGRSEGRMSLRRAQFKLACEEGNATMQIWLGKQLLGQQDKITHDGSLAFDIRQIVSDADRAEQV